MSFSLDESEGWDDLDDFEILQNPTLGGYEPPKDRQDIVFEPSNQLFDDARVKASKEFIVDDDFVNS